MNFRTIPLALVAVMAFSGSALPHHSHAYYAESGEIVLEGVVTEFDWRNPHSWITISVEDGPTGEAREWEFEARSPSELIRQGWKPDSLAPGDQVAVTFRPLRNGGLGGLLREVARDDGTILSDR